jgi:hypothetical protein
MEEVNLMVKISLIILFFISVTHSYQEYEKRKEPLERYAAALDFLDLLKNHVMCSRRYGISPGLIEVNDLHRFGYEEIDRYWSKPYNWEVIIRDREGKIIFQEGSLARKGIKPEGLKDVSIAYGIVAIANGSVYPARLEVWVWSS